MREYPGTVADKVGGHYIFLVGIRERNFIAYNVDAYPMSEEAILDSDLVHLFYKEATPVINRLVSEVWSSDCSWFFVLQDEGVYLMNTFNNKMVFCKKHSHKFIEMFIDAPLAEKKKTKEII